MYPALGVTWRLEDQGYTVRPQHLLLSPRGPKERGLSKLICVAEGTWGPEKGHSMSLGCGTAGRKCSMNGLLRL